MAQDELLKAHEERWKEQVVMRLVRWWHVVCSSGAAV